MVLKTRMRAPKCHLSFSKERERKKSSYRCSNNNKKIETDLLIKALRLHAGSFTH